MLLGQKQIPQPQLLGFRLQLLDDGRVGLEAALDAAARGIELGLQDGVGGDAVVLDKLLHCVECLLRSLADEGPGEDGDAG